MLGFYCRVVPLGPLHPVLLRLPRRVSVSLVTPQEPYGIFCDSQGVTSLQSCLSREALPFQTRDGSLLLSPQVSQGALIEPWKSYQLSQGLSKTSSVCLLLSQAVKLWSCLPEL